MNYKPGLHILSRISTQNRDLLVNLEKIKTFYLSKIQEYNLQNLGEVFHKFDNGGFTGVICLSESHLAIHTWPEYGLLTFDVFISNFLKDNDEITRKLFQDTISYFSSTEYTYEEVRR